MGNQPQTTFSGVDGTWWSGAGAGACPRSAAEAATTQAAASTTRAAANEPTILERTFIAIEYSP